MVAQRNAAFAEESAEVEVLLASLAKTKDLTKRIASSMSRLDDSGKIVTEAIGPIYSNTQQLQITSQNIDRVNEAIERLRQPLDARGREEAILRAGPQSTTLPQYLAAFKRVERALTDLSSSNLRSNQQTISHYQSLLSDAVNQLQDLYRDKLKQDIHTIEPLHYITKQLPFPTIPQENIAYLTQIASVTTSVSAQAAKPGQRDDDAAVRIYGELRGDFLQNSLLNLATASISTSKRRPDDAAIYRQGSSGIGAYASAIEGMFLAEHDNVSRIFRGDIGARVLNATCTKALANFARTLSELNSVIKARIMTDCFLAYEIIDLITPLSYRLESRTGQFRTQVSDALRPIRETARSSLTDLLNRTRSQAEALSSLPSDGNTVPLVSDTAARLQNLAVFDRPLASLLSSLGDGNWRSSSSTANPSSSTLNLELSPSTASPTLLSSYLLDLLDALLTVLTARSQALHRTKPLQGIFLLNTIAILSRAVTSSPELSRYIGIPPHNARLDTHRKSASSLYLSAWREPSAHLLDTIHTSIPGSKTSTTSSGRPLSGSAIDSSMIVKSLTSKDKDKIKEKFKLFNASFDELVARHKSLYMEKEVRGPVCRDIQAMIEPLYARFWDRYHEVDKGKGKVVKYSKGELVSLLATL